MVEDYKSLKRVENTQDATLSNLLLENFIMFFDWGFTDLGGFYSVEIPEVGLYGGNKHELRPVQDPNYNDGQVWEGFRSNWVWETGVQNPEQPIQISGVFIGGTFRATGNIQQPFHINYPDGRVVLDTAISTTSEVKLEYSHKWVNVIIRVSNQHQLDVYINGTLTKSHILKSVPKQNYGNVYATMNGGFSGFMSDLRYFGTDIGTNKIQSIIDDGPNMKMKSNTSLTKGKPRYLSTRWFFGNNAEI